MANQTPIPVVVNGAGGKMGREVIKAVAQADDMTLVGAFASRCRTVDSTSTPTGRQAAR